MPDEMSPNALMATHELAAADQVMLDERACFPAPGDETARLSADAPRVGAPARAGANAGLGRRAWAHSVKAACS